MPISFIRLLTLGSFLIVSCSIKKISFKNQQDDQIVILKNYYPIAGCGNLWLAAAYKFSSENNDSIWVGIIRCPDMDGEGFYKEGERYLIQKTNVNIADSLKDYIVNNYPQKEKYRTFLITKIKKF